MGFLFKKKKSEDAAAEATTATAGGDANGGGETPSAPGSGGGKNNGGPVRDPRKARRFFEHAETVAETRNYDYAIECYLNGLRHDPDNMIKHEAMRDIALRRKVSGGKPATLREKMKFSGGKDKISRLLSAEFLWSKDPLNLSRMVDVMEKAVEAEEAEPDLHMAELAYWVGNMILEKGETDKQPTKQEFLKLRDLFSRIDAWQQAVEAARAAMQLDPKDDVLADELKDLEAELAMAKGNYTNAARDAVRDKEAQEALLQEGTLSKTESAADQIIARRRQEFEEDPQNTEVRLKLVKALVDKDSQETENEAIKLLGEALEQTGQYRHKAMIGDIRIKQLNRDMRRLKAEADAHPKDEKIQAQYKELTRQRIEFELQEYAERSKNYPTDMKWRFELGKRQFMIKQYDEAMANFQQAKSDPKVRPASHAFLGRCYLAKKWNDEAIDTLRAGLEFVPDDTNPLALEMRWYLFVALAQVGAENKSLDHAREAQKVGSQILQTDVNYRNIRDRLEQVRLLVKKLQADGK